MADPLSITDTLEIPAYRIVVETMRSGGPGGQHANTSDTAVRLRLDLDGCQELHPAAKRRIKRAYPGSMTNDGELLVVASHERSQLRNLEEARDRLAGMIREHLKAPPRRKRTRPSRGSIRRRLKAKTKRGEIKKLRGSVKIPD